MSLGFEVSVNFHDSTSPRKRQFTNYSDLTQYLERVPNMLGFISNQKVTITVESVALGGPSLFDIPVNPS